MPNASADFFDSADRDEDPLLSDLKQMVRNHSDSHARHHQKALGPSEVGHPCGRNIIARTLDLPAINPAFDPLASYIGVASHAAMENAANLANERQIEEWRAAGSPTRELHLRWIPEKKVTIRDGLAGTCDLYDTETNTVIDYKFPGVARMTLYRKEMKAKRPPSHIYRVQAHLYGRGYKNLGFDVQHVGIWFLPRAGMLSTSRLWKEPYDDSFVDEQLARLDSLYLVMDELDIERHPQRLSIIPKKPYECGFCPFFTVTQNHADPHACQGGEEYQPAITSGSSMTPPKGS